MVLLVKCTRRCVKKEEGSGGESIYIHDPRADLDAVRHTTRHTSENHRYTEYLFSVPVFQLILGLCFCNYDMER